MVPKATISNHPVYTAGDSSFASPLLRPRPWFSIFVRSMAPIEPESSLPDRSKTDFFPFFFRNGTASSQVQNRFFVGLDGDRNRRTELAVECLLTGRSTASDSSFFQYADVSALC
jgi:hypothetical protein